MNESLIIAAGFALIGSVLHVLGWRLWRNYKEFMATAMRITARVVDLEQSVDSEGTRLATPVYEFTLDGATRRVKRDLASNFGNPSVGESVEILYSRREPSKAKAPGALMTWVGPMMFIVVGGIFAVTGVGILIYQFL